MTLARSARVVFAVANIYAACSRCVKKLWPKGRCAVLLSQNAPSSSAGRTRSNFFFAFRLLLQRMSKDMLGVLRLAAANPLPSSTWTVFTFGTRLPAALLWGRATPPTQTVALGRS